MIRYALRCSDAHQFESWFQSAAAFDTLQASGRLSCPVCGGSSVEKAVMAPRVQAGREPAEVRNGRAGPPTREAVLAALRSKIEREAQYVGPAFAAEARAIHQGDAPERAIYGEARPEEARALIEDGVPVAPLPFVPSRKVN